MLTSVARRFSARWWRRIGRRSSHGALSRTLPASCYSTSTATTAASSAAASASSSSSSSVAAASAAAARNFLADRFGFQTLPDNLYHNLGYDTARAKALQNGEGVLSTDPAGALACSTGIFTGRSPNDKYIECPPGSDTERNVAWDEVNRKMSPATFDALHRGVTGHYAKLPRAFVYDGFAGVGASRIKVRIVTELAWHHMFCKNMFIPIESEEERRAFGEPDFTIVNACNYLNKDYERMGLNSDVFIAMSFERKLGLIGGSHYSGEMKKGVFSLMNYLLPLRNVLSLHCSATRSGNPHVDDNAILMAGLSGTGKTTLSSDPKRRLIGDDEHGWDDEGVFNFEGGCYAKVINLDAEKEPDIYNAIKPNAILENVTMDARGAVDFSDGGKTQNTRVSYPIEHVPTWEATRRGPHPRAFAFLTCDAFGVLPPVARLNSAQAMYHFVQGYTAKVAGTERGVKEPTATFSTCFGAAFLPLAADVYAKMLAAKMDKHGTEVFLVNTGWVGGSAAQGAQRMDICVSRAVIDAIVAGAMGEYREPDPIFGLRVPKEVPGVESALLDARAMWADEGAYEAQARMLAQKMHDNFKKRGYDAQLAEGGPLLLR